MKLILNGIYILYEGLKLIDQAQQLNEQNANVFYIRAIIKAFLSNYGDAVTDVDKAIEKSEDNVPKYFYFRGLVYGCSRQFKPAISDFSICINLDENFADAYLQRARC
jgi:tetratricopeptide (TPR) repeat protein